jgi:flagellar biosynthesis protein FlhA
MSLPGASALVKSFALPGAILLLVALMVVPIPAFLLDVFFIMNIMISLAVLMVALNAQKPLDFSAFPDRAAVRDPVPPRPQRRLDPRRAGARP